MPKFSQNLVVFVDQYENAHDIAGVKSYTPAHDISLKGGRMIFNRFCIDEDAAFELSGVYNFKKWSIEEKGQSLRKYGTERKLKGKE